MKIQFDTQSALAIGAVVLAMACYAFGDSTMRCVGPAVPWSTTLVLKAALELPGVLLCLLIARKREGFKAPVLRADRAQFLWLASYCVTEALQSYAFWRAVMMVPNGVATAAGATSALVAPVFAALLLGQPIQSRKAMLLLVSIGGAWLAAGDAVGSGSIALLLPISIAFMGGFKTVSAVRAANAFGAISTASAACACSCLIGISLTSIGAGHSWPSITISLDLAARGGLHVVGMLCLLYGVTRLHIATVSLAELSSVPLAMAFGWMVAGDFPSTFMLAGGVVIVLAIATDAIAMRNINLEFNNIHSQGDPL